MKELVACPGCGWSGLVEKYDIGDGPEWNCPTCDMCWPENAVIGADGLTNAERSMFALAREGMSRAGWPVPDTIGACPSCGSEDLRQHGPATAKCRQCEHEFFGVVPVRG